MSHPIVFGPTVALAPQARTAGRGAAERPDDRSKLYVAKLGAVSGVFLQIRDGTWQTEETITTMVATNASSIRLEFDTQSNMMLVFMASDGADWFVWGYYRSADGLTTSLTALSRADGVPGITFPFTLGLTAVGINNFRAAWVEQDVTARGEVWTRVYNGSTSSWDASATELPTVPNIAAGIGGVVVRYNCTSGVTHYSVIARTDAFSNSGLWHFNDGNNTWFQIEQTDSSSLEYWSLDMEIDPRSIHPDRVHLVAHWREVSWDPDETSEIRHFMRRDGGGWGGIAGGSPYDIVSNTSVDAAMWPMIEVDSNGDDYVVWVEFDGSDMAIWFRRRLDLGHIFETPIKIDVSNWYDSEDINGHPLYPTMFKRPRTCVDTMIEEFCVNWGDGTVSAGDVQVWVTCAPGPPPPPPPPDEIPDEDLVRLDTVYVYDEPAGGPWAKWQGTELAPLNVVRWLTLDPILDDNELLWGTGDFTGGGLAQAWVRQLLTGTDDMGEAISFHWQTGYHDAGEPGIVKMWRGVSMRVSTMGGATTLTFNWDVDDGRRVGSFTIKEKGQHFISLPQVMGRVFWLRPAESSILVPPIIQDMSIWVIPKRNLFHKRAEVTTT